MNSGRSLSTVTQADITKKFKMAAVNPEINVSTFVHDSNEIPTAIPMFLG